MTFIDYDGEIEVEGARLGCGKEDENLFEPEYAKGIVARATLYFLLRYPQKIEKKKLIWNCYSNDMKNILSVFMKNIEIKVFKEFREIEILL